MVCKNSAHYSVKCQNDNRSGGGKNAQRIKSRLKATVRKRKASGRIELPTLALQCCALPVELRGIFFKQPVLPANRKAKASGENRTPNLSITNATLCQLSYAGVFQTS